MDTTAEGSTRRSSFAEASVTTPAPLPSETETALALVPVEPICLESSDCQVSIPNECVPIIQTPIATTDILNDIQGIYAKVKKAKLDSELALSSEKEKRIELERQLAEKEELLQKALADNNSLTEALSEREEEVESLKQQVDEDNERFQHLGNILECFRILKGEEAEKDIPSDTLADTELKPNTGNTNQQELPSTSSSNRLDDVPLRLLPPQPTVQTADASVQTNLESRIVLKAGANNNESVNINHGVDRDKSGAGFYCLCGHEAKRKYDLRDHIRRNDPSSYVFQCHHCDKKFWRTTDLRMHMMRQHQLRYSFYGCRTCGSQFSTIVQLMNHHRMAHNYKTMNGYTKRSDPFSIAIRHTKVTSKDPGTFLCSCGKKYHIRKSLNKHICRSRNLITKKTVVSAKKDKVQKTETEQRHGLAKPKNEGCKMVRVRCICSARFESRRELIKHVQRFEKSYNNEEEEEEEEDAMSDLSCD